MKQLFILRSIPGSGKSTIAKIIANGLQNAIILSADDLRMVDGNYQFIPEYETYVWEEFLNQFEKAINDETENIIIDNTNLQQIHYEDYKTLAIENGYIVHEIIVGDFDIDTCYKRCSHDVPLDKIKLMKEAFSFPK